jgi:hypothetical protein
MINTVSLFCDNFNTITCQHFNVAQNKPCLVPVSRLRKCEKLPCHSTHVEHILDYCSITYFDRYSPLHKRDLKTIVIDAIEGLR